MEIFDYYLKSIKSRLQVEDPNYLKLNIQIAKIQQYMEEMTQEHLPEGISPKRTDVYVKTQKKLNVDDKKMEATLKEEQAVLNSVSIAAVAVLIFALIKLFKWMG